MKDYDYKPSRDDDCRLQAHLDAEGNVVIGVIEYQGPGYKTDGDFFICHTDLPRHEAERLRDWLNEVLNQ